MTSKVNCNICASEVHISSVVKCPFCEFDSCSTCIRRFLMEIEDSNPRCMNTECKKVWSFEFLSENFPATFHNEKYRERRASILFGHEKSMLPATQPLAIEKIRKRKIRHNIVSIQRDMNELESIIRQKQVMINDLRKSFDKTEENKETLVKELFVRACPVENCRGFLSTALKCGTCEGYACKHCHLPKSSKYDEDHTCNADTVATIKLLASDTKACPACSTPIYKIQGCDQMYCTQCHTAFSWLKGTIERGTIHNPHYYEWQRSQQKENKQQTRGGEFALCGGIVPLKLLERVLSKKNITSSWVLSAHRLVNHILYVELPRFPNNANPLNNTDLRVSFLLQEISEVQLISKIKKKMKKQEKDGSIHMILSMFTTIMIDLFGNIVNDENNMLHHIHSMKELRTYTNTCLHKIKHRFKGVAPFITEEWTYLSNSGKEVAVVVASSSSSSSSSSKV
jgi:hypothetical protein